MPCHVACQHRKTAARYRNTGSETKSKRGGLATTATECLSVYQEGKSQRNSTQILIHNACKSQDPQFLDLMQLEKAYYMYLLARRTTRNPATLGTMQENNQVPNCRTNRKRFINNKELGQSPTPCVKKRIKDRVWTSVPQRRNRSKRRGSKGTGSVWSFASADTDSQRSGFQCKLRT